MKSNVPTTRVAQSFQTHEGGEAESQTAIEELTRAVSNCLLFEDTFYESGSQIAKRMAELCNKVSLEEISKLAFTARHELFLRHVPLFLAIQMCRVNSEKKKTQHTTESVQLIVDTIDKVIQRPDELSELVSIYWKLNPPRGKNRAGTQQRIKNAPLPAAMKKGLAKAFLKFNAYQLAKWNRLDRAVKLKDVLFSVHAKPQGTDPITMTSELTTKSGKKIRGAVVRHQAGQGALWKQLINNELPTPDTWEVALSAGKDKKATWERLIQERKLGYMALLMNLRNMTEANVDPTIVNEALLRGAEKSKALPFRFISAAKFAPAYAGTLSDAMIRAVKSLTLAGKSALLIDVSGSMCAPISAKSTLQRWEVAAALGILLREITPLCRIFTYSDRCKEVQNLKGIGLVDAVKNSGIGGGTYTEAALKSVKQSFGDAERVILITDEQAHDGILEGWGKNNYIVNVAPYAPGLEAKKKGWIRINGWSNRLMDWISLNETGHLLGSQEATAEEE